MSDQIRTTFDHQLKYAIRVVILKQSPDGQPFWPIPDPPPPTIDARRESSLFYLPGQHDIACGDLLIDNPSSISNPHWVNSACCHLVEHVGAGKVFGFVVAKFLKHHDVVKLPDRIYFANDFIKLHKPNPIDDLDAFVTSVPIEIRSSRPRFAIFKQSSDDQSFWPIPSEPLPKIDARLLWRSGPYYLFCLPGQHNIVRGDLLMGYSGYYIVEQVSIKKTSCLVFAELVDVVKLPDRVYLDNDFIELHKPKPIDDLAEFVASLTIGDVFDNRWPSKSGRANIYIFRDADVIFYVGSSPKSTVYNRIRAHLGIGVYFGHFKLHTLVEDNLPNSRSWVIDLYRVNSANVGDILRREMQIIQRLCPIINTQGNPCPMPLPMRYKWRWRL